MLLELYYNICIIGIVNYCILYSILLNTLKKMNFIIQKVSSCMENLGIMVIIIKVNYMLIMKAAI